MTPARLATHQVDAMVAALAVDHVRIGWRPIDEAHMTSLTAAEAATVDRAVPRRQAEFATGRCLLRTLIGGDVEILRAPSGAPVLPAGSVGSLAHDHELVIAAVAPSDAVQAIGIDVEPVQELEARVAELVVRSDDIVPDALTAFVAKEAAYKAWSVLGGEMLEHHDVKVVVEGGRYRADLRGALVVDGALGRAAGRVVAIVVIPAT